MNFCVAILILKMEEHTKQFQYIMLCYFKKGKNTTEYNRLVQCMEKVLWLIECVKSCCEVSWYYCYFGQIILCCEAVLWSSNPTSENICGVTQNTNSKEHKHLYVHFSVIHNRQDMEAAQISIHVDKWIKQLWDIYTMGYYLDKKEKKRKCYPLWQYEWTWRTLC